MSFTSIYFLFAFVPLTIIPFLLWKNPKWRLFILCVSSVVFIAWTDLNNFPLFIFLVLVNYFLGGLISKFVDSNHLFGAKILTAISVLFNLSVLVLTKYFGFIIGAMDQVFITGVNITPAGIPLGISYITFTSIAYLLDIYFGKINAEKSFIKYSTYIFMFPKIIQGPITRYKEINSNLSKLSPVLDHFFKGSQRFMYGLAKKVLIADQISVAASKIFDSNYSFLGADMAWLGLFTFGLQIYIDFSSYTDMAIGLGTIFGIALPENFNYPYLSKSVSEFWRKWHMTLTSWFRSYVFLPLEFSNKKGTRLTQAFHILVVFFLTGLWHGASWNFIFWGIYFGVLLGIELLGFSKFLTRLPGFFQYLYTWLAILFGWMMFRLEDISRWAPFANSLVGGNGWASNTNLRNLNIVFYIPLILIAIAICTPVFSGISRLLGTKWRMAKEIEFLFAFFLFLLAIATIITNGFLPFEYQDF